MKNVLISLWIICFFFTTATSVAQPVHADIEGDLRIRGNIDMHFPSDSTSLYIGKNVGTLIQGNELGNVFIGVDAGSMNTSGNRNTFAGYEAGQANTTGIANTFLGQNAGLSNTDGWWNTFVGTNAGILNISGLANSFFGIDCGLSNTSGDNNAFFGNSSGMNITHGSYNTFFGSRSGSLIDDSLNYAIAIGYNSKVDCDNCAVIGGTGTFAVRVGIGVDSPSHHLTLLGSESQNVTDMAITSQDALIALGSGKGGPHGFSFGDQDVGEGLKLVYRSTPNELVIEAGNDFADNTVLFAFEDTGELGIGTSEPNDALDVVGDIDATGCIQTDDSAVIGGTCTSDRRLKKNIVPIGSQLPLLLALNPVTYGWKEDNSSDHVEIGLIAQEVEKVIPGMVVTGNDGTEKIRYDISLQIRLIKALQEQQEEMVGLKDKVAVMEAHMAQQQKLIEQQQQVIKRLLNKMELK